MSAAEQFAVQQGSLSTSSPSSTTKSSSTMTTAAAPPSPEPQQAIKLLPSSTCGGPPNHYLLDREDVWQRSVRSSGRATSINSFLSLILSGLTYLTVYGLLFWLHTRWITTFGMEWVWSLIFVASSLDVLAGVAGIAGVARSTETSSSRAIGDAMSLASVLLLSVGLLVGVAVFFGLPSEDSWGQDWHRQYPQRCYNHHRVNVQRNTSAACSTLRSLAVCVWATFVSFLLRMLVLCLSQWSVWRAKHGDHTPPTNRYVVIDDPVMPSRAVYHPNYYASSSSSRPYLLMEDGSGRGSSVVVVA